MPPLGVDDGQRGKKRFNNRRLSAEDDDEEVIDSKANLCVYTFQNKKTIIY